MDYYLILLILLYGQARGKQGYIKTSSLSTWFESIYFQIFVTYLAIIFLKESNGN